MKKVNKILSVILAILMVMSIIPITASAAIYSGACGDDVTWTYDDTICTLTISGTGTMYDYKSDNRPWESYEDKIKTVIINDGVTTIGAYAFYSFGSVECITIPKGIYAIGKCAFNGCKKITSITIPDTVTIIKDRAFMYCDGLTNIVLPNNITSIDEWTFAHCVSLTNITIPESVTTIGNRAFYDCKNLGNIIIPKCVTTIGDNAFSSCYSLKEIAIPDSVISIDKEAFSACKNLTTVKIPASVTTIGEFAFSSCEKLTTIMVDSENQYYSTDEYNSVLFNKDKTSLILYLRNNPLTSYNIPDTVTTICDSAFIGCQNLTSITISKNVEVIGDNAFELCTNLTSLIIPDSVKTIGDYAFYNCFNLESVKIGNGVTSIGNCAFTFNDYFYPDEELQLKELTLGNSVTIIGENAFEDCKMLTSVTIPDSVTVIGYSAFIMCQNLKDVKIGNGVTTIAPGAFSNCYGITEIIIPNNVTTIEWHAFAYCSNLERIIISDSVTQIGNVAFGYCSKLSDVYYTGAEEKWNEISIGNYNQPLLDATIHYNYHIHKYNSIVTEPTCTEQGYTTYTCECSDSYVADYVNATGHTEETIPAVAPTCTETGLTEGAKCSICGETLTEQKDLPANGHSPANAVEENYVAPTCTENGSKDVVIYCSVCEEEISCETVVINATGHNYTTVVTEPTCTTQGYITYTCSCGETYVDDYVNATGHADNDGDGYCDDDNELLDPSVECDHNCHKDGISGFIWKIINFFNKLFGLNKTCDCGVAHY